MNMELAIEKQIKSQDPLQVTELSLGQEFTKSNGNKEQEEAHKVLLLHVLPIGVLDHFTNLEVLSLVGVGLQSLANFPCLPNLKRLDLSKNQLSSELGCLEQLKLPHIIYINLSYNKFSKMKEIEPLNTIETLHILTLKGNPVTRTPDYRRTVFLTIHTLKVLDKKDINGIRFKIPFLNNNSDSEDDKENQYNNNNSNNSPSKGTTTLRPRTAPPPVSGKLFLTFEQTSKITSIASSFNSTIDITGYGGDDDDEDDEDYLADRLNQLDDSQDTPNVADAILEAAEMRLEQERQESFPDSPLPTVADAASTEDSDGPTEAEQRKLVNYLLTENLSSEDDSDDEFEPNNNASDNEESTEGTDRDESDNNNNNNSNNNNNEEEEEVEDSPKRKRDVGSSSVERPVKRRSD